MYINAIIALLWRDHRHDLKQTENWISVLSEYIVVTNFSDSHDVEK